MRKIIVAIVIALFTIISVEAQEKVSIGAKVGVNFSKIQGDAVENADGRTGFHFGAIVEIPITEKFSVQPEILYSQQGLETKTLLGDIVDGLDLKLKLDYITVPVLAKYNLINGLSIEAGPQFGFLAKAESETDLVGGSVEGSRTDDVSDQFSSFEIGAAIGAEYELNSGLFFQARYIIGVSNADDNNEDGFFQDDLTNSNLQVSVGFKF